ncbi:MAG TPA: patatin-like phospholipase family protein [Bryobacteraceae bacterium]
MPVPDYLSANRKCDIVMKGGITSGVVYPHAVVRLAREYRFQSIGGTSAGAIAASLTAAAEYRRRQGISVFEELAKIPEWLGAPSPDGRGSNLLNLFQPQDGTEALFGLATALLSNTWGQRIRRLLAVIWPEFLLGSLPGIAAGLLMYRNHPGWGVAGLLLGLLFLLLGGCAGVLIRLAVRLRVLPRNHFGLCLGYSPERKGLPVSLTGWLHTQINSFAGRDPKLPLTFGDLDRVGIELKMITTALTFGRPYTLPFESPGFYFSKDELSAYFPEEVMEWMVAHAARHANPHDPIDTTGFLALPDWHDLPIVVGARMSLSFPVLFCPVPLYAIDWTRRRRGVDEPPPASRVPGDALGPDEPRRPECVWFSDGGICANFPIHLFDAPLPAWPTFAIDLRPVRPDRTDRVWMPRSNRSGIAHYWSRFNESQPWSGLGGMLGAIVDAAQSWNDNLQTMVLGYRDRIVHIYLDKNEGGLNLEMSSATTANIARYGAMAADRLIEHFVYGTDQGSPTVMTWDNHRWVRYRSTVATLETFLTQFSETLNEPVVQDVAYEELIRVPPSYPMTATQQACAHTLNSEYTGIAQEMNACPLTKGAPRPTPVLRVRPQF